MSTKRKPEQPSTAAIAEIWARTGISPLFTHEMKKAYNLDILKRGEVMIMVGSYEKRVYERTAGKLIAVCSGVVIYHPESEVIDRYATGLLKPVRNGYEVEVFAKHIGAPNWGSARFGIGPGRDHPKAAAQFTWSDGLEAGGTMGITHARWSEMHPWLEYWLG